jgi:hypothetical protein
MDPLVRPAVSDKRLLVVLMVGLAVTLSAQTAEQRAVDYLARETPRWSKENGCFSCHNNGDAARALFAAARLGYKVPKDALADTIAWLSKPSEWDGNPDNPGFSDKKLARIQFAAALVEANVTGDALTQAAELLLPYQEAEGSWKVDAGSVGSPATYGTALATYMARRTIEAAYADRFAGPLAKANLWFLQNKPRGTLEFAALLMALPIAEPDVRRSLELLLAAQAADGGWGPYPATPTEPFDTAVALLALQKVNQQKPIARGRAYLIAQQQPSGGWIETTRPPGGHSYAQHISTTAWATLALVMTNSAR